MLHRQRSDEMRLLKREDVWRHVMALSVLAGLKGDVSDGVIRFHALRHHLISFFLEYGVSFAHDTYWTGHQTAGAELLHSANAGSLSAMWAEIEPALHAMLAVLGMTDACIAAIVRREGATLKRIADAMRPAETQGGARDGEDNDDGEDRGGDGSEFEATYRSLDDIRDTTDTSDTQFAALAAIP